MKPIVGFPPVFDSGSRILILGSMPGEASLAAGQYYAHPRNAFWPLIAGVLGVSMPVDYADRLAMLQASGVALWDVIARCKRQGSLDSAIVADTVCVNDFEGFFRIALWLIMCFSMVQRPRPLFAVMLLPLLDVFSI